MIQNITNLFTVNNSNKPKAPMSKPIVYNRASAPDAFVRTTQSAPAFKGLPYSHERFKQLENIAFDAEESEEDLKGAEAIHLKNFHEVEKFIKNSPKDAQGKPIPITNKQLINNYTDATFNIVTNLGLQKVVAPDEYENPEEADVAIDSIQKRSENYLQRALSIGDRYFAPEAFAEDRKTLEDGKKEVDKGDTLDRMITIEGKDVSVYDFLGLGEEPSSEELVEELTGEADPAETLPDLELVTATEQTSPKKVLEIREDSRKQVKKFVPEQVSTQEFSFETSKVLENFTSLSLLAASNAAKEHKAVSGAPKLKQAYRMLDTSQKLLQKKDPQQIYWDSNEYSLLRKKISETAGTNTMAKESTDDFETLMGVQNEDLSLQKRIGHLEKLAAAPTLLGMIVAFDMHDSLSKGAIDLLSRNKSEEAKEQLERIVKDKDIKAHIKDFAAKHLPKK